jgi:hypothetical protein
MNVDKSHIEIAIDRRKAPGVTPPMISALMSRIALPDADQSGTSSAEA